MLTKSRCDAGRQAAPSEAGVKPLIANILMTMQAIEAPEFGVDKLRVVERPVPEPSRGEILIRLSAATLNYRDLAVLKGSYKPGMRIERPYIPASDACGVVVACGSEVSRFREGDRAMPTFTQGWIGGQPTPETRAKRTLGFPLDGVLREYIAVSAEDAVHVPNHLTDLQAAALPIAALTAWTTLAEGRLQPGQWVLAMGTGGVAIFALQFAKLAGARVAVISSSDEKLARARSLGADATFNYRTNPEWMPLVRQATAGRGADIIVETAGTLPQSLAAAAFGGFVGIIGFTGRPVGELDVRQVIGSLIQLKGISTGSRFSFEAMNRAIAQHELQPVVEHVFPLAKVAEAFALMERGGQFGKIGISIAEEHRVSLR